MPAGDSPSSRAATVSGSDDPKSSRKRSGNPAISSQVSLQGWRAYARFWPWPRGRHGTGRGRPGKTTEEVARSMARFSVARRGWQEEGATQVRRREEGGVTQEPGDKVGWGKLGPPLTWPDLGVAAPLKRLRVEASITGSAERAVKRRRLTKRGLAVNPPPEEGDGTQESGEEEELGLPPEQHLPWMPPPYLSEEGGTEDTSHCPGESVEKPMAGTGSADGLMANQVPSKAEGVAEKPVPGKTGGEIAMEETMLAENPVPGKTGGEIAMEETMLAEKPVPGKTGGEIGMEETMLAEGVVAVKTGGAIKESSPKEEALETSMDGKTAAEIALAKRWLPKRYPKYPSSGKFEDFLKYTDDCKRIRELNEAGYARSRNLPTWGVESEHETKASVDFEEWGIVRKAGESVVFVSSTGPGHKNTCGFCSGVIISCGDDGEGTIRILTSSGVLYDHVGELRSTEQKVSVKLPSSHTRKYEGHVLYVNKHYNIAILKVYVGSSMATLSFGSMPRYGQRVIALGRDSKQLFHRKGIISTLERTSLGRTHYMFPKSENGFPLISTGGPVIGEDGKMVGIITCHVPETVMMSISIVQSCLDMWKEYSCIARPQINMDLRTVDLLPVHIHDPVNCIYKRPRGFIIDGVEYDSNPEKVGIRKGDIIEIVDEACGSTLPELEVYLLKHGLKFLPKVEGLASTKELEMKIRVHDLVEGSSTDTKLCIPVVYEEALP